MYASWKECTLEMADNAVRESAMIILRRLYSRRTGGGKIIHKKIIVQVPATEICFVSIDEIARFFPSPRNMKKMRKSMKDI